MSPELGNKLGKTLLKSGADMSNSEPMAWAVVSRRGIESVCILKSVAMDKAAHFGGEPVALYELYRLPITTDAQREAVRYAAALLRASGRKQDRARSDALLALSNELGGSNE
jgi:hypothetical protein